MGIIALLGFIFVVLPILSVVAVSLKKKRNRHNWT